MVSENFAKFFSEVVRRHRKGKRLSQELLAEKANLSSKMISLVERGERNPSIGVADSIARGLSIPLWRLIKDAEDSRRDQAAKKKKQ